MKFSQINNRLEELEQEAHAGLIPTTDRNGNRVWLKHSGISTYRELLHAERLAEAAGHEFTLADLSPELAEALDLWSRAELASDCGALAVLVREQAKKVWGA